MPLLPFRGCPVVTVSAQVRAASAALLLLALLGVVHPVAAATPRSHAVRLSGHVLSGLGQAERLPADPRATEPLTLTLVLARNDQAGFEDHVRRLYDPTAPEHRRFVDAREIADRFGPSEARYDRVQRWCRAQGLRVVATSPNRLTLTVQGSRRAVAAAFAVRIDDYRLDDATFFANDRDPSLPAEVASALTAVTGLSNLGRPRPVIAEFELSIIKAFCTIGASFGALGTVFKTYDWNKAYLKEFARCLSGTANSLGLGTLTAPDPPPPAWQGVDGTGQTIGIVAFDGFVRSDVEDYLALLGLPAAKIDDVTSVHVNGGAGLGPDQSETLLDLAHVLSGAPGAKVTVFDAPFTGSGSFQAVLNAMLGSGVTIISNSWAYCENQTTLADVESIDSILQSAAAQGISVFSASGDRGSTCLNGSPNTAHVPASSPFVTAVGGTSFTLGPGFTYGSEIYWNGTADVPPTGAGGFGMSRFFPRPAYQNGLTTAPMRSIPDVATNADPKHGLMICQAAAGGCPTGALFGGTSAAAPAWAAFTALLNQSQGTNLGFLNPLLYPLAGTDAFHGPASLASDFAHVGLGSPNLARLHQRLTSQTPGATSPTVSQVTAYSSGNFRMPDGSGVPLPVAADGTSHAFVVVRVADATGNIVAGHTVTLAASAGSDVEIAQASGVSSEGNGAVVFTVTNLTTELVTFTATDTTANVVLATTADVEFVTPPAASGGMQAFPTTVPANGTSTTTITVTLQDGLGRPAPGKEIRLAQGSGHSIITGPSPSVTDAAGQIQFTVTNRVNEVVTYTAIDVTDGDLPVPGSAQVTWSGATTSCVGAPPVGQNGFAVTPFANGFVAENFFFGGVNWGGCPGASNPVFRGDDVFIANFRTGGLYRFGVDGGAVSSADLVSTLGQTLGFPVVGQDGKLYALFGSSGAGGATGSIVEIDPATGTILRTLASNQKCPAGLAVDPLSGDLFFTGDCFGAGLDDAIIHRIRDPESATPTLETYATLSSTPTGVIAFAPNGTLYVATNYTGASPPVVRVAGTDKPAPPAQTTLAGVSSIFWVAVAAADSDGEATALLTLTSDGVELVDLTNDPPSATLIATGMAIGPIGPDGCLYSGTSDTVYKVTRVDGTCDFTPGAAVPSLTLAPSTVAPDPAQGTTHTLTATFRNLDVPAGTPVFFVVTGVNERLQIVRTDDQGEAALTYAGKHVGADAIQAHATVGATTYYSNAASVTWTAGRHTTFMTLNLAPRGGMPGVPSVVTASLVDTSAEPNAAIAGQTVTFTRGDAQCTAVTDAQGAATCLLLADPGQAPLTATFAGTPDLAPATDTVGFAVGGGGGLGAFSVYTAKTSKGATAIGRVGPVTLADAIEPGGVGYDVQKLATLAAPAAMNGLANPDPDIHLTSFAVKRAKGAAKFVKRADVRLANQCSDSVVTLGKPTSLLVPTTEDLANPPLVPTEGDHDVDHFLCYKVKLQKKRSDGTPTPALRKGIQVDVADAFQTTRYELGKVVLACNPAAKSGSPLQLAGPGKGTPFPITPATVRNPATHLLCYAAKIASKRIEQTGCGPTTPGDKGTKIVPKQAKHTPRLGVHLANQLGATQSDTKKATLICLPSVTLP